MLLRRWIVEKDSNNEIFRNTVGANQTQPIDVKCIDLHCTRSPSHMEDRSILACQEIILDIFSDNWWPFHRNENYQRLCLYNANERVTVNVNRLHERAQPTRSIISRPIPYTLARTADPN